MIFLNDHVFCARKLLGSAGSWFIAIRSIMLSLRTTQALKILFSLSRPTPNCDIYVRMTDTHMRVYTGYSASFSFCLRISINCS